MMLKKQMEIKIKVAPKNIYKIVWPGVELSNSIGNDFTDDWNKRCDKLYILHQKSCRPTQIIAIKAYIDIQS